jgi:hypothetical protein
MVWYNVANASNVTDTAATQWVSEANFTNRALVQTAGVWSSCVDWGHDHNSSIECSRHIYEPTLYGVAVLCSKVSKSNSCCQGNSYQYYVANRLYQYDVQEWCQNHPFPDQPVSLGNVQWWCEVVIELLSVSNVFSCSGKVGAKPRRRTKRAALATV